MSLKMFDSVTILEHTHWNDTDHMIPGRDYMSASKNYARLVIFK